ncbi:MAG: flagellar motor switch protein FliG [Nitrospiraceae bacterium]|nr:flagellar motor switch protein FliG [Nitrospiraceae bacterium]
MGLSGYEKAAIFLASIGKEAAAEVLKVLDMKYVEEITKHMTRLSSIRRATLQGVLDEVNEVITKGDMIVSGDEFIKEALSKGLGEESAGKVLEVATKSRSLDSLKWVDAKTLSNFLVTEHPQTVALIVSLLEAPKAAEVLVLLPDALKSEVSFRIAMTERIPESAIEELNETLKGHLDVGGGSGKKIEGAKTLAEILNHCDRSTEQKVLEAMEERNAGMADSVRGFMFVFDDLAGLDDKGIQVLLKDISTDDLTLALKTASQALKDKLFKNMSQRAAELLKEEMQNKGPARVSDVEKAQQSIVKIARKLEAEGRIILAGKGDEELVV